jgi:DNA-directed RNA polymerase subunit M/transcription elongation factor TFIIS
MRNQTPICPECKSLVLISADNSNDPVNCYICGTNFKPDNNIPYKTVFATSVYNKKVTLNKDTNTMVVDSSNKDSSVSNANLVKYSASKLINNNIRNTLRWLAVMPIAILAGFVVLFLSNILISLGNLFWLGTTNSIGAKLTCNFISGFCGSIAFINSGVYVAPNYRTLTAQTLSIIGLIFSAGFTIYTIIKLYIDLNHHADWKLSMFSTANTLSATLAFILFGFSKRKET